ITYQDIQKKIKERKIDVIPFAYMRGLNFHNSFVVVDEGQNILYNQFKLLLGRFGQNSKMVILGDPEQSDLKPKDRGAFSHFAHILGNIPGISHVKLGKEDIIREPIVGAILERIEEYDNGERT